MIKQFAPHGLAGNLNPADTIAQTKAGQTVLSAKYGAMRRLPTGLDPLAFSTLMDDFHLPVIESDALEGGWVQTTIGNAPTAAADAASLHGAISLTTDTTAQYDGGIIQAASGSFAPTAGPIWWACRFKFGSVVTNLHVRLGAAVTLAHNTAMDLTTLVKGIHFDIGTGAAGRIATRVVDNVGTKADANVGTLVTDTWYEYSFHVARNGKVYFYIDRKLVDTQTPGDWSTHVLRPYVAISNNKASDLAALTVNVDYIFWARAR
jgi:hypothetical protein